MEKEDERLENKIAMITGTARARGRRPIFRKERGWSAVG
jgi:hypothetical protein